jgi:hypothetical protein
MVAKKTAKSLAATWRFDWLTTETSHFCAVIQREQRLTKESSSQSC